MNNIRDDVVEAVRQLKLQPGKNILVDGSSVLIHVLAQIPTGVVFMRYRRAA